MKIPWKQFKHRIPSRVQLGQHIYYEICWVEEFDHEDKVGETRPAYHQILIKTGEKPKDTVCTYGHELIHAIDDVYNIGLTETQVQKLEKALPFLLKEGNIFKELK